MNDIEGKKHRLFTFFVAFLGMIIKVFLENHSISKYFNKNQPHFCIFFSGRNASNVETPLIGIADTNFKTDLNSPCYDNTEVSQFLVWTPLQRACRCGQADVVAKLLSTGADPTERDELGTSILFPFSEFSLVLITHTLPPRLLFRL